MHTAVRHSVLLIASATLTTGAVGMAVGAQAQATHPVSYQTAHHATPSRANPVIRIRNFAFHTPASVRPGATVRIVNRDGTTHTVTSNAGLFSVRVPAGATRTITAPRRAGTYRFQCKIHSDMHGRLKVS